MATAPEDGIKQGIGKILKGFASEKEWLLGSALRDELKNPTAEAKVASDACFTDGKKGMGKVVCETTERKVMEQHRKSKQKRMTWDLRTIHGMVDGAMKRSDTAAKHLIEVAGTKVQVDNGIKFTQSRSAWHGW
jgi:hypothetical protein